MSFLNFIRIISGVFNLDSLKLSFIQHNFEIFEIEILVFVFLELSFIYYNEERILRHSLFNEPYLDTVKKR